MRKLISFISICLFCFTNLLAQGSHIRTTETIGDRYLLATLPFSGNSTHQKLRIEIMGGGYGVSELGRSIYSISTRDGLIINKENIGGKSTRYDLKIYDSGNNTYEFVLESKQKYLSAFVQVWLGEANVLGITPVTIQTIKTYQPGNKLDVTSLFTENNIYTIDKLGDVGLGTETPQAKLDVRGKVIADEVEIKVNKGADFVFKPDYNLKPLSEVEAFVRENQHLPEVPSEKEMQQNGLNVNDMQIKLLQKIEELTLYVIEQNKKIAELEKKVGK